MWHVLAAFLGAGLGAFAMWFVLESTRRRIADLRNEATATAAATRAREESLSAAERQIKLAQAALDGSRRDFESQVIGYKHLEDENKLLKRDLRNLDIHVRKLQLDQHAEIGNRESLDSKAKALASRFLRDTQKSISAGLRPDNFSGSKDRLMDAIAWCRKIGYTITSEVEQSLIDQLREDYRREVRRAVERERAAAIRARMREEAQLEREAQAAIARAERDRELVEKALARALADTAHDHAAEIAELKQRLADAEARKTRAISQAQLTKCGTVYVISNIGSFGEDVFKIGMTRRLEPLVRVRELGDASVPFPFDVHMLISSDDAPALENALHKALHSFRINRVNPRREFFRVDFERVRALVEQHHGHVEYTADPDALQYRQSLTISDEDEEFIESVYDEVDDESDLEDDLSVGSVQ